MNVKTVVLCTFFQSDIFTKRHDFPFRNLDRDLIFDVIDVIDMPVDHFNPFDFRSFEMVTQSTTLLLFPNFTSFLAIFMQ